MSATPSKVRIRLPLVGFPRHESEDVWAVPAEEGEGTWRVVTAPFLSADVHSGDRISVSPSGGFLRYEGVV
ncbi:MAG: hypothetical protein KDC38_10365, partial [Planctomycetes bacterium]|nr:hypothetical protein [Planctomycetota bacterium]